MNNQKNKKADTLPKDPPSDNLGIRCPRLGHQINFSYCMYENSGLPCFKTLDCWHPHFDAHAYLQGKLTEQDFKTVFLNKGKPKVLSLLGLIEQAKKSKGK